MRCIYELVARVKARYPNDTFFMNFDRKLSVPVTRDVYLVYERAFRSLDPRSWEKLKNKAVNHYMDHRQGQRKQGFFNQLNEAFAYRHLVRRGYRQVRVLPETGSAQPDLEYLDGENKMVCEVKTIGISNDELSRRASGKAFCSDIYCHLDAGFMNKLTTTLDTAAKQIDASGNNGMVYLIMLFDDFTLDYYDTYRKQIRRCIHEHFAKSVYAKVGVCGNRYIQKSSTSNISPITLR